MNERDSNPRKLLDEMPSHRGIAGREAKGSGERGDTPRHAEA